MGSLMILHKPIKSMYVHAGIILAIALLLVGACLVTYHQTKKTTTKTKKLSVNAKIDNSIQSGSYDKAKEQVKASYPDEKQQLLVLASVAVREGKYKDALDYYKQYEAKYPMSFGIDEGIAKVYQKLNDKANTIAYYQKAIDALRKVGDQFSNQEADRVQKLIDQLKK